jgi:hypothetical protein
MPRRLSAAVAVWITAGLAGAASNEGIAEALAALRDALSNPAICEDPPTTSCDRTVESTLDLLADALEALTPDPGGPPVREAKLANRALTKAVTAVKRLERAHLDDDPAIGLRIEQLIGATAELVADSRDEADAALDELCSSRRISVSRKLRSPERQVVLFEQATIRSHQLTRLRLALKGFDGTESSAEKSKARCRLRACSARDSGGEFTAGDPANPSLELIPPDKGTLLDFDFMIEEGTSGMSGEVRLTYGSLTSVGVEADATADLPGLPTTHIEVEGKLGLSGCTDPQGWTRLRSLTERVRVFFPELDGRVRSSMIVRAAPPTPALYWTLSPFHAGALELRVGDQLVQSNVEITDKTSGEPTEKETCSATYRVIGIENVTVGLEDLPAARIEMTTICEGEVNPSTTTTWLASRLGQVKVQATDGEGGALDLRLVCYEEPGRSESCGEL